MIIKLVLTSDAILIGRRPLLLGIEKSKSTDGSVSLSYLHA